MRKRSLFPYLLFFAIIPILQVLIFLYMQVGVNHTYFILSSNSPVSSWFLQNYTQLEVWQVVANVVPYFVLMTLIFMIEGAGKRFYADMGIIFLAVPFLISAAILASFQYLLQANLAGTYGFSGIDAALIGYFLCLLVAHLNRAIDGRLRVYSFLCGVIGINIGLVLLTYFKSAWGALFVLGGVVALFIESGWVAALRRAIAIRMRAQLPKLLLNYFFAVFGVVVIFCYLPLMQLAVAGIGAADVTAHISGYALGLLVGCFRFFSVRKWW